MNTEQAIKDFENLLAAWKGIEWAGMKPAKESYKTALSALRAQQERENPKPLTLEQLKERVGKPVFLVHKAGGRHWDVLTKVTETTEYGKTEIRLFWRGMFELGSGYYPECTQYFDYEPKESII